jgi:hypothetical protein
MLTVTLSKMEVKEKQNDPSYHRGHENIVWWTSNIEYLRAIWTYGPQGIMVCFRVKQAYLRSTEQWDYNASKVP